MTGPAVPAPPATTSPAPTPANMPPQVTPPVASAPQAPIQLPDDHPLVKALAAQKATIADLKAKAKPAPADADPNAELLTRLDEMQKSLDAEREAREAAEAAAKATQTAAALQKLRVDRVSQHPHLPATAAAKLVSVLTGTDEATIDAQINEWLPLLSATPGVPQPNPQQGNPPQARGGSLVSGRERYIAANAPKDNA